MANVALLILQKNLQIFLMSQNLEARSCQMPMESKRRSLFLGRNSQKGKTEQVWRISLVHQYCISHFFNKIDLKQQCLFKGALCPHLIILTLNIKIKTNVFVPCPVFSAGARI